MLLVWLGDGRQICKQEVVGLTPDLRRSCVTTLGKLSVTIQYNLLLADGQSCCASEKISVGLALHCSTDVRMSLSTEIPSASTDVQQQVSANCRNPVLPAAVPAVYSCFLMRQCVVDCR